MDVNGSIFDRNCRRGRSFGDDGHFDKTNSKRFICAIGDSQQWGHRNITANNCLRRTESTEGDGLRWNDLLRCGDVILQQWGRKRGVMISRKSKREGKYVTTSTYLSSKDHDFISSGRNFVSLQERGNRNS